MAEIAERNPLVSNLLDAEEKFRLDYMTYRSYALSERARLDLQAQIDRDNKRYEERGEKLGEKRTREEMLRTLRAKSGMTDEQIAEMFDLPVDLVKGIS